YNREYTPGQLILTIVGDITTDQVAGLAQVHFGPWKKGAAPPRNLKHPAPVEKKTVQLIEKDLTQSNVILGHGGISRNNPDFYAVTVMNYILGAGGFSSRLMVSISEQQRLGVRHHEPFRRRTDARFILGQLPNTHGSDESGDPGRARRDQKHP